MNGTKKTQSATLRLAILVGILTFAAVPCAYAQSNTPDKAVAKMTIVGINGDNADGTIEVVGIDQRLNNPPPATGTNTPTTYTLVVTKKIDRATPRLFLAGMTGETLAQVKVTWSKINSATNQEEFSHSITLKNVLVSFIHQRPADSNAPETRQSDEYEDIIFSFNSSGLGAHGSVDWEYALPGGRTIVHAGWDFGRNLPQ